MFSNTLTKLSLIPPCLFPDGKTLLEKWMYLMPCRHFQRNWGESHHPSLLPASHRMGPSLPAPCVSGAVVPWGALGHGWWLRCGAGGQDLALPRAELARGCGWGSVCVAFPSCGSPAWPAPWARPQPVPSGASLKMALDISLWIIPRSCFCQGKSWLEISLCFRSCGWAPREQEPAQAVCSGLHEPRLGHRRCHFVLVHIPDYQLVQLFIAIHENWWCFFLFR